MSRKFLLVLLVFIMVVSLFAGCSSKPDSSQPKQEAQKEEPKVEEKVYKWRLSHVNTETTLIHETSVEFAKMVKEKSNGRLIIDIFANGQLGNEGEAIEQVNAGALELTYATAMGVGPLVSELSVLDAAFVIRDIDHQVSVVTSALGKELKSKVEEKTNMKIVAMPTYGVRHLTTRDTEVHSPKDAAKLKVRAMDFEQAIENVKSLGATPIPVPFPELYTSLQQKIVDGQENPLNTILATKFYEVQKYAIKTGHVVTSGQIILSKQSWDALPEDLQKIVAEAGDSTVKWAAERVKTMESQWGAELEKNGMTIVELTPEEKAVFQENAMKNMVPLFKDRWVDYYERIAAWK
ncbi:MAG: hypothetical protein VR72_17250 [Clostridiaceae bacterium BRH_c20a]|nr:MAG: hypothetical protein VR72_17250 [Clostridiaceae bacterium BRH_c20a]